MEVNNITKFPYHLIDLTHSIDENSPSWDGACGFKHEIKLDYDCSSAVQFRVQEIKMKAGIGTHIDAPAHCIPGAHTIDELELSNLIAPCVVIDVSKSAHELYSVSPEDIQDFEKTHGTIDPGSFVMMQTGWEPPDRPEDGYLVHAAILGAGKYIIENAANLSSLPAKGSFILALPIKTKGGTEAPVRLIGLVEDIY